MDTEDYNVVLYLIIPYDKKQRTISKWYGRKISNDIAKKLIDNGVVTSFFVANNKDSETHSYTRTQGVPLGKACNIFQRIYLYSVKNMQSFH